MPPRCLSLFFLLAGLALCGCSAPTLLAATQTPLPTPLPTLTPRPGRTPFIMPTMPLWGSKTPTPISTLEPTVTPLPVHAFTRLVLHPLYDERRVYQRVELSIETDGSAGNPFDPVQVDLRVLFTSPAGQSISVPAFWFQDFDPQTLAPLGAPGWRARFTPTEAGEWQAQAELAVPVTLQSAPAKFTVQPAGSGGYAGARGFVRVSQKDPHYFAFDDGTFYFPVGLNMGWAGSNVLGDYALWLDHLSQNGGNYIRVWMADWSFGLEWNDTGLGNYAKRMKQAWLLDQVFTMAEQRGVYLMLCLVNHGAFSDTTNPEWSSNPYNAALGGPLEQPQDFVTDPTAKAFFKRRVRYIAARWAYSPALAFWEWWNEVNWTPIVDDDLKPWIIEMTAELQKYDPYHHLVSTSYATGAANSIWSLPALSLAQQHDYSAADPLRSLPDTFRQFEKNAGGKPVLLAEYGSSANGEVAPYNQDAIHLHNGLWAAPFSGYAGTAMYWWWDNYIEPQNLWYQFDGIAGFMHGENLENMTPGVLNVQALNATAPEGAPNPPSASAMILQNHQRALVWVRADGYSFQAAKQAYDEASKNGAVPLDWKYNLPVQKGLGLILTGLENGRYQVIWYSTLTGPAGALPEQTVTDGTLLVLLPDFRYDLAFKVIKK